MSHRCLEFLNTEGLDRGRRTDRLGDARDLVAWLEASGAIDGRTARDARRRWCDAPIGGALLAEARALRRTLRRAIEQVVDGGDVPRVAVAAVNHLLAQGNAFQTLVPDGERLVLRSAWRMRRPSDLLLPIAEAAADLLAAGAWRRIGRCAHSDCIRFFYDGSKGGTRRWCDMRTCGNRANAAAHYRRARQRSQRRSSRVRPKCRPTEPRRLTPP